MTTWGELQQDREAWLNKWFTAAKCGDAKAVEIMLELEPELVRAREAGGLKFTAIFYAIMNDHGQLAEMLLNKGAPANDTLMFACALGRELMVDLLIKHNVDAKFQNQKGETALTAAAEKGFIAIVHKLVRKGDADINHKTKSGETALILACKHMHLGVAEFLLKQGASVHGITKDGKTALSWTMEHKFTIFADMLRDKLWEEFVERADARPSKKSKEAAARHYLMNIASADEISLELFDRVAEKLGQTPQELFSDLAKKSSKLIHDRNFVHVFQRDLQEKVTQTSQAVGLQDLSKKHIAPPERP